jgi:hypothetical protein
MSLGKTIKIFLTDGSPSGIMTAEMTQTWTGKVLIAPRPLLSQLIERSELERGGVYILVGDDPRSSSKQEVYIGHSDNLSERLRNHNYGDKDFWSTTVVIIDQSRNLTSSHTKYLESRMIELTSLADIATLHSSQDSKRPNLPESDTSDTEAFLMGIQLLLPVLGFSFMVQTPKSSNRDPVFQYTGGDFDALAQELNGSFVVLKDSRFRAADPAPSISLGNRELRSELIRHGKLVNSNGYLFLTDNLKFSSPSAAASVISGNSVNGRVAWKLRDEQKSYAEWDQERFK